MHYFKDYINLTNNLQDNLYIIRQRQLKEGTLNSSGPGVMASWSPSAGAPAIPESDAGNIELENRMRNIKQSGDRQQSKEYLEMEAELNRRKGGGSPAQAAPPQASSSQSAPSRASSSQSSSTSSRSTGSQEWYDPSRQRGVDITQQSPERIAAMNDPARGGQSGRFGNPNVGRGPTTTANAPAPAQAQAPAKKTAPAPAPAPAQAPAKKAAPPQEDGNAFGPPLSLYEPPVQDTPIAPPANASPRVQATDAAGNPSNTPEARRSVEQDARNPSGAHTPIPTTNAQRSRQNAQRQNVFNDGSDHGGARPPEPTAPQREFERSTQQPTTGVGPDGETLPQAEKRIADERAFMQQFTAQGFVKSLMKMKTPTYSRVPSQEDGNAFGPPAPSQEDGNAFGPPAPVKRTPGGTMVSDAQRAVTDKAAGALKDIIRGGSDWMKKQSMNSPGAGATEPQSFGTSSDDMAPGQKYVVPGSQDWNNMSQDEQEKMVARALKNKEIHKFTGGRDAVDPNAVNGERTRFNTDNGSDSFAADINQRSKLANDVLDRQRQNANRSMMDAWNSDLDDESSGRPWFWPKASKTSETPKPAEDTRPTSGRQSIYPGSKSTSGEQSVQDMLNTMIDRMKNNNNLPTPPFTPKVTRRPRSR